MSHWACPKRDILQETPLLNEGAIITFRKKYWSFYIRITKSLSVGSEIRNSKTAVGDSALHWYHGKWRYQAYTEVQNEKQLKIPLKIHFKKRNMLTDAIFQDSGSPSSAALLLFLISESLVQTFAILIPKGSGVSENITPIVYSEWFSNITCDRTKKTNVVVVTKSKDQLSCTSLSEASLILCS